MGVGIPMFTGLLMDMDRLAPTHRMEIPNKSLFFDITIHKSKNILSCVCAFFILGGITSWINQYIQFFTLSSKVVSNTSQKHNKTHEIEDFQNYIGTLYLIPFTLPITNNHNLIFNIFS